MTSILEDIRLDLGRDDIFAYIGGLHLYKLKDSELDDLCDEIEKKRSNQNLYRVMHWRPYLSLPMVQAR